jgi:phage/plasmid-associated DNA primase
LDSPYEYRCIINKRVFEDIQAANGKHNAIAAIAYKVLQGRFVCAAANNKLWYEFDGNLWKEDKEAINLRHQLSTTVRQHYIDVRYKLKDSLSSDDLESNESRTNQHFEDLSSKLLSIAFSLQDENFKDGVLKGMREYFYDGDFLQKLDSKINLIAFTNGVWDLANKSFRHTQPEDYVSLSVGFDYNPEINFEYVEMVKNYWVKLHPDQEQRNYVINTIARQLYGDNGQELFHIHAGFQGAAGNGKTKFFEVLEGCLGDYVRKFPVQVLTAKNREEAGKPAPEMQYWKGRRILYCTEPKDDDILHSGIMKDLTGGEQILYRLLFSNEVHTFRPQYKMHIMCNDPPKVDGSDEGVRRRIRKIDYISRFVNHELVNESEHYYIRDGTFFEKLKDVHALKMETIRVFLNAYNMASEFNMPISIANNSQMYLDENNPVYSFVEKHISGDKNAVFTLSEAKDYYKSNGFCQSKLGKLKPELEKILRTKCLEQKRVNNIKKSNVFVGFKLSSNNTASHAENCFRDALEQALGYAMPKVRPAWLCNPKTGCPMELDFFDADRSIAIEYDGPHHYEYPNKYHKTKKEFHDQQERDKNKETLCKDHGICLIRVKAVGDTFKEVSGVIKILMQCNSF